MGIELDPRWQEEAYEQVKSDFENGNRSCIVAPTGSGKSAIALKLFEENSDKEILYVSSSGIINQQIKKRVKEIYGRPLHQVFPNVKMRTYNSLSKMPTEEFNSLNPEIAVYDELHRAGAEIWQIRAKELLDKNKDVKLLGMTATPVRTEGRDMAEELCDGVSYELKLTEAVARGILPVPIYITARYLFNEDIKRLEERIKNIRNVDERSKLRTRYNKWFKEAKNNLGGSQGIPEILSKYKEYIGDKCLIFCKDTEHIDEIADLCEGEDGWFNKVNSNLKTIKISYINEKEENLRAIELFRKNEKGKMKIALACEMLNEGFHDEELTTGILARPTKSEILFRQQLGRFLIRNGTRSPIIFDLVNNIKYFQEFRREVEEIIRTGISQGKGDKYNKDILEQFAIMDEEINFIKEFQEIEADVERITGKPAKDDLLNICEALRDHGVDFTKIQLSRRVNGETVSTTVGDIIKDQGIDARILKQYDFLDKDYKIGQQIRTLRQAYKGTSSTNKITEEERERAEKIKGLLSEERKTVIEELLDICEILKAKGIDFTKVQLSRKINGKDRDTTIEDIIKEQGIDVTILKEYDLDKDYRIGQKITVLRNSVRGTGDCTITEEDRKRADAIVGLIPLKRKTTIEELLDICEILKENGVDFTKAKFTTTVRRKTRYKTLGDILKDQDIDDSILEKYKLDKKYEIGKRVDGLRRANKGTTTYKITEEDRKRAEVIEGLIPPEEKTAIEGLLDICEILKTKGVDFKKVQITRTIKKKTIYKTIKDILNEQEIDNAILQEYELDGSYKIGQYIMGLRQSNNGTGCYTITEEDKKRAKAIEGLIPPEEKTVMQELLDICEILKANGVDFTKVQLGRVINNKKVFTTIREILEQQGINREILEKYKLNDDYKIGQKIDGLRKAYRGKDRPGYALTEEEKDAAERLGLVPELAMKERQKQKLLKQQQEAKDLRDKAQNVLDSLDKDKIHMKE